MKKHLVLIVDDFHPMLLDGLNSLGIAYEYFPEIREEEVLQLENKFSGLLIRSKFKVDSQILNHLSNIGFIGRGGAGMDGISETACKANGVALFNAPEGNRDAVAEHTIACVLAWYNKIVVANNSVNQGHWLRETYRGMEIKNKTIGIIGFGNTGKEVARRWQSFGCQILCYDINEKQYDTSLAKPVKLAYLQKNADVISFHIPFLKANRHLVNSRFISQLKSSSLLVNMSRGDIFNTQEVLQALSQNDIAGLCLDVLEGENKNEFPSLSIQSKLLLQSLKDKIIITPHIAGWTKESYQKIAEVILQKITNYILKEDGKRNY